MVVQIMSSLELQEHSYKPKLNSSAGGEYTKIDRKYQKLHIFTTTTATEDYATWFSPLGVILGGNTTRPAIGQQLVFIRKQRRCFQTNPTL